VAYKSVRSAARNFSVASSTLTHRLNGHVTRNVAHENDQNLMHAEKKVLVLWMTCLTETIEI
jgi:hypothetical protein